jgi:hypothetical protein
MASFQTQGTAIHSLIDLACKRFGNTYCTRLTTAISRNMTIQEVFTAKEQHLYGSSRLGIRSIDVPMATRALAFTNGSPQAISTITLNSDSTENGYGSEYGIPHLRTNYTTFSRELGNKQYELVNHLGNVMVTVSDKKLGITTSSNGFIAYTADVISASNQYPYGSPMPGKEWNTTAYRFGMNTQEKDDEIYGLGNTFAALYWEYDARLGRRWNVDPVVKEYESGYSCFAGNPIWIVDHLGNDSTIYITSFSDITMPDGTKLIKEKLDKKHVKQIARQIIQIFNKNGIKLKFVYVKPSDVLKLKLDMTDSYINLTGGMMGNSTVYKDKNLNIDFINTFVNYDATPTTDEEVKNYKAAYSSAHEILHQLLKQASVFFGLTLTDHDEQKVPNLNAAGSGDSDPKSVYLMPNEEIPNRATKKIQRAERILDCNKRMLYYFIKRSHGKRPN